MNNKSQCFSSETITYILACPSKCNDISDAFWNMSFIFNNLEYENCHVVPPKIKEPHLTLLEIHWNNENDDTSHIINDIFGNDADKKQISPIIIDAIKTYFQKVNFVPVSQFNYKNNFDFIGRKVGHEKDFFVKKLRMIPKNDINDIKSYRKFLNDTQKEFRDTIKNLIDEYAQYECINNTKFTVDNIIFRVYDNGDFPLYAIPDYHDIDKFAPHISIGRMLHPHLLDTKKLTDIILNLFKDIPKITSIDPLKDLNHVLISSTNNYERFETRIDI